MRKRIRMIKSCFFDEEVRFFKKLTLHLTVRKRPIFKILCLFLGWNLLSGSAPPAAPLKAPSVLYLTWMHDPTTTMTVQWQSKGEDPLSEVFYRKMGESQ